MQLAWHAALAAGLVRILDSVDQFISIIRFATIFQVIGGIRVIRLTPPSLAECHILPSPIESLTVMWPLPSLTAD